MSSRTHPELALAAVPQPRAGAYQIRFVGHSGAPAPFVRLHENDELDRIRGTVPQYTGADLALPARDDFAFPLVLSFENPAVARGLAELLTVIAGSLEQAHDAQADEDSEPEPEALHEHVPTPGDMQHCHRCGSSVKDGHCLIAPQTFKPGDHVMWYSRFGVSWRAGRILSVDTAKAKAEVRIFMYGGNKTTCTVPTGWLLSTDPAGSRTQPTPTEFEVVLTHKDHLVQDHLVHSELLDGFGGPAGVAMCGSHSRRISDSPWEITCGECLGWRGLDHEDEDEEPIPDEDPE